jgi:ribosome-binding factor A
MSIRTERVSSMLQREIAGILASEYGDILLPMVTVTVVRVTRDLSIAYVYVSVMGDGKEIKDSVLAQLLKYTSRIRKSLASNIRHQLKGVPELRFFLDDTIETTMRLDELFGQIHAEKDNK